MKAPLKIYFNNVPKDRNMYDGIFAKAAKLEKIDSRIIGMRVAFEKAQKQDKPAGLYRIGIEITLPRHAIIVKKESKISANYVKLVTLVNDAFKAAARELERIKEKECVPVKGRVRKRDGLAEDGLP